MKRRIYKKWMKNPLNKRLMQKCCKPFPNVPPAAVVKSRSWERTIERLERIDRMKIKCWAKMLGINVEN